MNGCERIIHESLGARRRELLAAARGCRTRSYQGKMREAMDILANAFERAAAELDPEVSPPSRQLAALRAEVERLRAQVDEWRTWGTEKQQQLAAANVLLAACLRELETDPNADEYYAGLIADLRTHFAGQSTPLDAQALANLLCSISRINGWCLTYELRRVAGQSPMPSASRRVAKLHDVAGEAALVRCECGEVFVPARCPSCGEDQLHAVEVVSTEARPAGEQ